MCQSNSGHRLMKRESSLLAALTVTFVAVAAAPPVLAQAGSTGGTIGKQGKSAAGSSATEEGADKPAQVQRKPSLRSLAATTAAGPQYLGCFKDQGNWFVLTTEGRDLNGLAVGDSSMTSERCVSICRSQGFAYAGTQNRTQCFCGNKYGRSGQADNCNMACGGNPVQMCGGGWANSVYRVLKIK
jgi:hypothetical protein